VGPTSRKRDNYDYRKAITTDSAPSVIQEEDADRLIDLIVDESKTWQMASVVRMRTQEKIVRYVDLTDAIIRPRVCGTEHDTASITASACTLHTQDLVVQFYICDDMLDYNLEGPELEAHVLRMVAKKMANELEILAWMANTDGSYSTSLVHASTLALFDGWYKQLQDGHVIDAGDAVDTSGRALHVCKFTDLMRALPTKWRTDKGALRYFMPDDMHLDWQSILAGRQTGLGDQVLTGGAVDKFGVTPIVPVPLLPTDLTNCSSGSFAPANGAFMALSDPANFVLGIQKQMEYERWREAQKARTWHIWNIRFDAKICVPDATALYDCMQIGPCSDLYCQAQACV
jgi:hypothetical protein